MTDHVKVLKRYLEADHNENEEWGTIGNWEDLNNAIRALLEENEHPKDRGEDCDLCGEILGDAACEKCVGKLEARLDVALGVVMRRWGPNPNAPAVRDLVKALRPDQPEVKRARWAHTDRVNAAERALVDGVLPFSREAMPAWLAELADKVREARES